MVRGILRSSSAAVLLASFLSVPVFAQSSLNDLFQKGKNEFKLASYEASLKTFQELEGAIQQPGLEAQRARLEPLIAFYRGANHSALGQTAAAEKEFQVYLAVFPTAHLDPAMFPRSVIQLFEKSKTAAKPRSGDRETRGRAAANDGAMAEDYAHFRQDPAARSFPMDDKWAAGAIGYLMTNGEREEWRRLDAAAGRAEFIARFWQRRDPTPTTPENEFRDEIERRVAFADARFMADEKRGSNTDRGLVFVLLGPPSYVSQTALMSGDDPIQAARAAPIRENTINPDGSTTVRYVPVTALTAQAIQGTREIWHYRKDRLPRVVRFTEVDFEFVTKKGLGNAVLQRDPEILTTLDLVAKASAN